VYLTGGVVRDLLLGRTVRDVDLAVEGEALEFARRLGDRLGAEVRAHPRFGTASLLLPGGERLDVAATRAESYPRPGGLPVVRIGAAIVEDLARRDFTINALAIDLARGAKLLDPHGGRRDLARGRIRILHPGSFIDDPTRALRAARYAKRLGFRLDPETRRRLREALAAGALDRISADRLRRELRLILEEPDRPAAAVRMRGLGLDAAIDPSLGSRSGAPSRLRRAERISAVASGRTGWLCYLLAWMGSASADEMRGLAARLGLAGSERRQAIAWPATVARLSAGLGRQAPSEVRRSAAGLSPDELVAAASILSAADARALLRSTLTADVPRLSIRGADLRAAGVPAGPAIGRALEQTLAAREDGRIGPTEELAFALRAARGQHP